MMHALSLGAGVQSTTETRDGTKPMYLHRSLRRIDDVDLTDLFETGFDNECGGHCGV